MLKRLSFLLFKLHPYVCLLNSQFLLAALVYFSCILIGQFRFWFFALIPKFWVSHFCSNVFSPCFKWWKICLYDCSSLVVIFWYLPGLFICIGYRQSLFYVWKFIFCFLYYFRDKMNILWFQIHCTAVLAQLFCSFNPSGIFGLNSSISSGIGLTSWFNSYTEDLRFCKI